MLPPNTETLAAVMAGRGLNFGAATTCTLSMAVPRVRGRPGQMRRHAQAGGGPSTAATQRGVCEW